MEHQPTNLKQVEAKKCLSIKWVCTLGVLLPLLASAQGEMIRVSGTAQGTTYHISYFDSLHRDLQPEIQGILHAFDSSVSTYLPSSLLSRVNKNEAYSQLDPYFLACFHKSKEVWRATEGAFDPTVAPLVNMWGFGSKNKKGNVTRSMVDSVLHFVGFERIAIQKDRIVKKDPRVALDFNALAQGYSVDVVARLLEKKGIKTYLVEIGGEVYTKGRKPDGHKWTVGIEKPEENSDSQNPLIIRLELEGKAIATSGNYRKFYIENGKRYSHIIDPKTGYPVQSQLHSVSVIADDCMTADAYATGIMAMGLEKAKTFLLMHREMLVFLIYSDENGLYRTEESPGLSTLFLRED